MKKKDAWHYDKTLSLKSVRKYNLKSFSLFLQRLGPHGYRDWPEDIDALREALEGELFFESDNLNILCRFGQVIAYYWFKRELQLGRAIVGVRGEYYRPLLEEVIGLARPSTMKAVVSPFRTNESCYKTETEALGFKTEKVYQLMKCTEPMIIDDTKLPIHYTLRNLSGLEEADKLCAIQNKVFSNHYGYECNTPASIKTQLAQKGAGCNNVFLIEEDKKGIVAYCWTIIQYKHNRPVGKISMFGVLPEYRGQGLGRKVFCASIAHLAEQRVKVFELEVDADNLSAKRIYQQTGFKAVDHIEWMYKELDAQF